MSPPLARTSAEAHLFLELHPCDSCWERGFSARGTVVVIDGVTCSHYTGPCGHCGATRAFTFRLPRERPAAERDMVFGGPEPSELLDPGQWLTVADRSARPAGADDEDLAYAAAAVDEVLKFIPDGADAVPPDAFHTEDGREVYAREPGRFRRDRLEALAATYRELVAEMRDEAASA